MCVNMQAAGQAIATFFKAVGQNIAKVGQSINTAVGKAGGWGNVALKGTQVASGVAQTAVSMKSAKDAANAQKEQYAYQAKIARENERIAKENALLERQQGIEEARLQRIKTAQAIGSQQAAMAANGVDITQGTALDAIEDTAAMGELDALQTRYNYERKYSAYMNQAGYYDEQGKLDLIAGKNAYSAGNANTLASGLNGVSNASRVAAKWFGF